MLTITNILNPLTGGSTTEEYSWESGKSLADYIGYAGECLVQYGGAILEQGADAVFPADGDAYVVMPIPQGADKQSQRNIAYSILGLAAWAMPVTAAAAFHGMWMGAGAKAGAVWIGGTLINLFLRDKEKPIIDSPSYSWQHKSNDTAANGAAMPVIYGKARVRPTLKNHYITVDGDKQHLYALYSLAAHKVAETYYLRFQDYGEEPRTGRYSEGDIVRSPLDADEPGKTYKCLRSCTSAAPLTDPIYWKVWHGTAAFSEAVIVNGRAITDYYRDVEWETRPGLPEQAVIPGFDVTYNHTVVNQALFIPNFVEVNRKAMEYLPQSRVLHWDAHTMLFNATAYKIKKQSFTLGTVTKYSIYFDPDEETDRYFVVSDYYGAGYLIGTVDTETDDSIQVIPVTISDDKWYTSPIPVNNIHNIQLIFEFPYGLYSLNDKGEVITAACKLFAQYREYGTTEWSNFDFSKSVVDVGLGTNIKVFLSFEDDPTIMTKRLTRKTIKPFNYSVTAVSMDDALSSDKYYEYRVTASSQTTLNLLNVATMVYGQENNDGTYNGFTYPGEPLLGIKALASGQISGDLDVQVDVERDKVWVYDGTSNYPAHTGWNKLAANNHAWAVYDILANGHPDHPSYPTAGNDDAEAIYGCGIDHDRIDYDSFEEWADNLQGEDGLGYELNIVFDTFMTAWDAILRICQEGRGMIYPIGTTIFAFTDKAADTVQLFTMGNIHVDTFVQSYAEGGTRANMIEATYYDEERGYEKTTLSARTSDWDSSTDLNTPVTITLYGTTSFEQAYSIARWLLVGNELLNNVISFGVDVDGLAAQVGDVVEVDHDVLNLGTSGRVVSYTGGASPPNTVTLDRTVTSVSGYTLSIKHSDGTIETHATTTAGSTATLTFASVWDVDPAQYDVYSFGSASTHTHKYRITSISRTNELMRTLTLSQYDASLYTSYYPGQTPDDGDEGMVSSKKVVVSSDTVEELADLLNLASNLQLYEETVQNRNTGDYETRIVATWDSEPGEARGRWEIWFRDVDASDIDWQGLWLENYEYAYGDKVVMVDGRTYISLVDNNAGITPVYSERLT